jgi:hypothetical protein
MGHTHGFCADPASAVKMKIRQMFNTLIFHWFRGFLAMSGIFMKTNYFRRFESTELQMPGFLLCIGFLTYATDWVKRCIAITNQRTIAEITDNTSKSSGPFNVCVRQSY